MNRPTVDTDRLTGDEPRGIAGEEDDDLGDIFRQADRSHRGDPGELSGVVGQLVFRALDRNRAGRDACVTNFPHGLRGPLAVVNVS